ncbi:signal transduction histidine-protein kinase BarA [Pseudomonas sp. SCT]|uniref:CHASE3 domain-containing protein n=1 Tax=Pseudomonas sp. (strain SCT) TaxID=412955 RepID=UPI000ED51A0F|nr:CHASE3 domain-containing protein [Pseudomonas sp. SCT]GCA57407.1 signal transduction histidine-protein kinase BarA [Pseudomonas sp. SCT]
MPARLAIGWHSIAFLAAFLLLAALGWQGKRTQEALLLTNQSVNQSLEVITSLQAILSSLQDIESGARGFILTGEEAYLVPYDRGLSQLEVHRRSLQTQVVGRSFPDQRWFQVLDTTIAERLQVASGNIQVRRDSGLEAAAGSLRLATGRVLMDRLRGLLNAVEQRERRQLAAASSAVAVTTQRAQQLALVGSLVVIGLFLAAFWAVQRNLQIRQQLARTAQAGEARLGALLQAIPDHLYAVDERQRVSSVSRGIPRRAPAPEAIEPLLIDLLGQTDDGTMRQKTWCELQTQRTFEVRLMPTGLGDYLAIARDVSELQRNRDTLHDQQVFLRRVVDTDDNLIFARDAQGRFLLCNTALAALLNGRPQDIEQRRPDELPSAQLLQPMLLGDEELAELAGGSAELRTTEVALTDAHGVEHWFQVVKRPLRISARTCHVVTVAVDISLRRRMEQMKTEFISTVSHELRTPLTAIRGALGMLIGGIAGHIGDDARPLIDIAHKNSERLVRLINDILDIEKLEAGRLAFSFGRHDVRALVQQALSDIAPYAREYDVSVEFVDGTDTHASDATLDPDRFAQVMANLLSNAIKHSPAGGCVTVDLRCIGDKLELGVQDHGAGIPDAFRSRIFERFAQADSSDARQRGGTGLGLAITRSLVQQMHGQIGFDSQPGMGTRFWLHLPLAEPGLPPSQEPAPPVLGTDSIGKAPLILILEPDTRAAEQLAAALHQHGYATLIAKSAAAARELLTQFRVQALTLSPALDDENSAAFLQSLRSQHSYRNLPVLIVSLQPQRRDEDEGILRGGAVGVIDWLHKPIDPSRVLEVIRACLQTRTHRPRILHVEDDDDLRELLARQIAALDVELSGAATLHDARQLITAQPFDLAIIDLMLPDGEGTELFDQLAQSVPPPPVIIFSALDTPIQDNRLALRQLVKSRHDGDELAKLIQHLLQHWPPGHTHETDEAHP